MVRREALKMIWIYVVGVVAILFGIYQMVNSYKYVKVIQHHGNKTTSNFSALTVWYSFIFGLGITILGIVLIVTKGVFF
ncbi:hypothetical protein IV63_GL001262 [Companilactobacillus crustorum]|uniref:Immunity protein n=4 Tax=Companilactobacillus TaxID=2767879 RepID=A0A837RFS4_9LACO|nr:hypothetical protein BI355_2154 [Companilactobacillus crustorum]KRK41862.1 hypothetical protein FD26_GL001023 [Companilactobacillus crustorum JCM 15951]KRO19663.1 hypothetical protein IV63_GL001262 [Companilactobacillus crustorum]